MSRGCTIPKREMIKSLKKLQNILQSNFIDAELLENKTKFGKILITNTCTTENKITFFLETVDFYEKDDVFLSTKLEKYIEYINNVYAKSSGWFVNSYEVYFDSSIKKCFEVYSVKIKITLFPIYTEKLNFIPETIFHITKTKNICSIMRSGIIPKDKISWYRNYPKRVYIITNEKTLIKFTNSALLLTPNQITSGEDISILIINTKKLNKGTKFYKDPEFCNDDKSYYTPTIIPPEAIIKYYNVFRKI